MKILLCDDEITFLEEVRNFLRENLPGNAEICFSCNRQEAEVLLENEEFDLLLMDICLEDDNGILVAKDLIEKYPYLPVIFITGYPDLYYEQVFLNMRPWGFVKKPVDKRLLLELIKKSIQEREHLLKQWLFVRTKSGYQKIPVQEIYYLESRKHTILIHLNDKVYETYGRISDMECRLPEWFIHCHKSYLVNARHVQSYQGGSFIMDNAVNIVISQSKRKETRQKFLDYLEIEEI